MKPKPTITHCFATPNSPQPLDLVHPATSRGIYSHETLAEIQARHPGTRIVSLAEWANEKAAIQDAPWTWRPSTEEAYEGALEILPPASMSNGAFLLGEPYDHHAITGRPRYDAYHHDTATDTYLASSRPLTVLEFLKRMQ